MWCCPIRSYTYVQNQTGILDKVARTADTPAKRFDWRGLGRETLYHFQSNFRLNDQSSRSERSGVERSAPLRVANIRWGLILRGARMTDDCFEYLVARCARGPLPGGQRLPTEEGTARTEPRPP